ncbi:MAG: endonuclease [Candidatus Thermoplasmatota archaeon]|nr:endonuclease [Candidatus Thermoplasmatota archaeon]MCL5789846.1 endonuclease [Candidatus Thermoplasmatota archaeon]
MSTSVTLTVGIVLAFIIVILIISFLFERRISRMAVRLEQEKVAGQRSAQEVAQKLFNQWTETSVNAIRAQITETLKKDYQVQLESWKKQEEKRIRDDAIQKSINTLLGKIGEEFSPVLLASRFGVNLKDFRHLGTPVDFVAFRGLSDDVEDVEVLFLEIKSGKSSGLVSRERRIRDAVSAKRVRYEVVNIGEIIGGLKEGLTGSDDRETHA